MREAGGITDSRNSSERRGYSIYEKLLVLLFLLTLPLVNPWVRGDGVGYYAYVRALLIDHNLRFEKDWRAGNASFLMGRVEPSGHIPSDQYTSTGYLYNHFTVGPALLWAPFLAVVHVLVLGVNHLGAHIPADGFSRPYRVTMAAATATYGFMGLFLAFRLARKYFEERWAFAGTVGIWFASSLPVYMYFNPSWSHAHSAFVVSLFLWYWHRTRGARTPSQWVLLGALSGLMLNVYYLNGILLLLPGFEALAGYSRAWQRAGDGWIAIRRLVFTHSLYVLATLIALLPTLITRKIIFGSPWRLGVYTRMTWKWTSPAIIPVLFSSDHGLFSWTPVLIFAVLGLFLFCKADRQFGGYLLAVFFVFCYVIASYAYWHGLSSYGNRFFVSLTSLFVLGLSASVCNLARLFERSRSATVAASAAMLLLVSWNFGFIFQWGVHLVPARGPISWRQMIYNQVAVVPVQLTGSVKNYFVRRGAMMQRIEQEDLQQMKPQTRVTK